MMPKKLIDPGPSTRGWHHLQDVLVCPELYRLRNSSHPWEAEPDKQPFVRGELLHCGLAHCYIRKKLEDKGKDPDVYYEPHEAIAVLALKKSADRSDMWQELAPMVQEVVAAYTREWAPDDHWEVLHVEKELKARVQDSGWTSSPPGWRDRRYTYTQRADLIVRDRTTQKVWIVDHKGTYRIAPKTVRRYTLSGQFLGYTMLGEAMWGESFGGVRLNMVQFSEEPKFSRPKLAPAPAAIDQFKNTIIYGERMIHDFERAHGYDNPWPQTFSESACWGSYGPCPMHEICQWGEP